MLTNSTPGTACQPRSDIPAEPPVDTGTSARARSLRPQRLGRAPHLHSPPRAVRTQSGRKGTAATSPLAHSGIYIRLHATPHVPVTSAWLLLPSKSMDGAPRPAPACTAVRAHRGLPTSLTSVWWSGQHAPCDGRALRPLERAGRPASLSPLLPPARILSSSASLARPPLIPCAPVRSSPRHHPTDASYGGARRAPLWRLPVGQAVSNCGEGLPPAFTGEPTMRLLLPGPHASGGSAAVRFGGRRRVPPEQHCPAGAGPGRWKNGSSIEALARARWDNGWPHGSRKYPPSACKDG